MTDKTIDPERARLAIELADAYLAECSDYGFLLPKCPVNRIAKLACDYRVITSAKRIRDAEQELIKAALDLYGDVKVFRYVQPTVGDAFVDAAKNYLALVKDKVL